MDEVGCSRIVFSSSATVYQPAESLTELPLDESRPTGKTTNPYARSKLHVEEILQELCYSIQLTCMTHLEII